MRCGAGRRRASDCARCARACARTPPGCAAARRPRAAPHTCVTTEGLCLGAGPESPRALPLTASCSAHQHGQRHQGSRRHQALPGGQWERTRRLGRHQSSPALGACGPGNVDHAGARAIDLRLLLCARSEHAREHLAERGADGAAELVALASPGRDAATIEPDGRACERSGRREGEGGERGGEHCEWDAITI